MKMGRFKKSDKEPPNVINRRTASEKVNSNYLLGDFDVQNSNGLKLLKMISSHNLTKDAILRICLTLSIFIDKPILRDFKRRKSLLIKWIDINYDLCLPYIQFLDFGFVPV